MVWDLTVIRWSSNISEHKQSTYDANTADGLSLDYHLLKIRAREGKMLKSYHFVDNLQQQWNNEPDQLRNTFGNIMCFIQAK